MSDKENSTPAYIEYPYDRFLKLRIEFLIITQNDLQARIMRIIERCVENERDNYYRSHTNKNEKSSVPDNIFAEISHKFFMDELYGTVQSETTLRDAIDDLVENKHVVLRHPGNGGPYDAPFYALNKPLIAHLFTLFPSFEYLNMREIMKQPRKSKDEEVQKLHPLTQQIRGSIIAPPDPQLLHPYSSIIAPLPRSRGVQKLHPKRYRETKEEKREDSITSSHGSDDTQPSLSEVLEQLRAIQQENARLREEISSLSQQRQPAPSSSETEANKELFTCGQSVDKSAVDVQGENANHIATTTTKLEQDVPSEDAPSAPIEEAQENGKGKGKGSRKPSTPKEKTPKRSAEEEKRINDVFDCLDKVASEVLTKEKGEPFEFTYGRPETDRERIYELLKGRTVSSQRLRAVYIHMWNIPKSPTTGFEWKKNMSIAAICRHYDTMLIAAMSDRQSQPSESSGEPTPSNIRTLTPFQERNRAMRAKYLGNGTASATAPHASLVTAK